MKKNKFFTEIDNTVEIFDGEFETLNALVSAWYGEEAESNARYSAWADLSKEV